jgi:hypothetical protein
MALLFQKTSATPSSGASLASQSVLSFFECLNHPGFTLPVTEIEYQQGLPI